MTPEQKSDLATMMAKGTAQERAIILILAILTGSYGAASPREVVEANLRASRIRLQGLAMKFEGDPRLPLLRGHYEEFDQLLERGLAGPTTNFPAPLAANDEQSDS